MYTFEFRRGRQSEWTAANPVLHSGEPGFEEDTGRFKMGNGIDSWNDLEYFVPGDSPSTGSFSAHINSDLPHPVYDDGAAFTLLYENAKV